MKTKKGKFKMYSLTWMEDHCKEGRMKALSEKDARARFKSQGWDALTYEETESSSIDFDTVTIDEEVED